MNDALTSSANSQLEGAGLLLAQAIERVPSGREPARWLGIAADAVHQARQGGPHTVTSIALAHGRVLLAAVALVDDAPAAPLRRSPVSELLLGVCARLLTVEEQLLEAEVAPAAEPELPLAEYPVERCGGIAALIHCRPADAAPTLEVHGLDGTLWSRLMAHWSDEMAREIKRGKNEVAAKYDGAYVAQLERERGEITVDDYVGLKVAAARGVLAGALLELRIPRPAVMSIERLWLSKLVDNDNLRSRVRQALERQRAS